MIKVIAKINGCDLILKHEDKFDDVSKSRINQAEKWVFDWIEKGAPYIYKYVIEPQKGILYK